MKAIIMAGGEGTRLRPLTCSMPKPMARVMNKTVMEHIIELLKKHGITEIGVTLMYMPDVIRDYFGDGSDFGVKLTYFCEESPLGTAGSVKNAGSFLNDDFLVISGDALCDTNLTEFINYHKEKKAEVTIALKPMELPLEYGVVVTNKDGKIIRFLEKPAWSQVFSDTVNTGIYIVNPSVLDLVTDMPCDFSKDVFPCLLSENRAIYGYVTNDYWCDIGDLDVYRHCHYDIFDGKLSLNMPKNFISNEAYIEDGAIINPPVYIGSGTVIKSGAVIDSYSVIGDNVTVYPEATVKRSIIYDNTIIGSRAQIRGTVICSKSVIRNGASVFEQAVIGENVIIGDDTVVKPAVKIWPSKTIGNGQTINQSIIWGNSKERNLFSEKGIVGQIGTDIHPEFAVRTGAAYGTVTKGGKIAVSSDGSPAAVMLKSAFSAGLMSSGAEVYDLGDQPLPITRSAVPVYGLKGAIHSSVYQCEAEGTAYIDILNSHGANISKENERKTENLYMREDFERTPPDSIADIKELYEYKLYYLRNVINSVKNKKMDFKVIACTTSYWGKILLKSAAEELGFSLEIKEECLNTEEKLKSFSELVIDSYMDLGVVIDNSCETLTLIDDRGRLISNDLYKAICAYIIMKTYNGPNLVVDVSAPSVIDEMAKEYGAEISRTKESPIEFMNGLTGNSPELRDQFILHFDAVGAVMKILDFLKSENKTLSSVIAEIPPFYFSRCEVNCSFGDKGRIMRSVIENSESGATETIDGVKINSDKGWVLILPHRTRSSCRVIAHSDTEEYADELATGYAEMIENYIKNSDINH